MITELKNYIIKCDECNKSIQTQATYEEEACKKINFKRIKYDECMGYFKKKELCQDCYLKLGFNLK
jgi:aspartyl/asparaginyl-tRNA synthetase